MFGGALAPPPPTPLLTSLIQSGLMLSSSWNLNMKRAQNPECS